MASCAVAWQRRRRGNFNLRIAPCGGLRCAKQVITYMSASGDQARAVYPGICCYSSL